MNQNDGIARWPDGTPKSGNNGFTHGWLGQPLVYTPGPAKPTVAKPCARRSGGFAKHNGTIQGMGPKPHQALTIKKKSGAMA